MTDRSDLIVQYFDYLVSEYGFRVEEKVFAPQTMGNAYVVFKSNKVGVQVAIDKNEVWICMGDQADPTRQWFPLGLVLKYFSPSSENVFEIPKKTTENTWNEIIEIQLKRFSTILPQFCKPFLEGDLSCKDELVKIQEKQVKETIAKINSGAWG